MAQSTASFKQENTIQPISQWQVRCLLPAGSDSFQKIIYNTKYQSGKWIKAYNIVCFNDIFCNHPGTGCNDACKSVEWFDWEMSALIFDENNALNSHQHHLLKIDPWEGGRMELYINDSLVLGNELAFSNSFMQSTINLDPFLHHTFKDRIRIVYFSPTRHGRFLDNISKCATVVQNETSTDKLHASVFLRKPIAQYGWDLAPRHVLVGPGEGISVIGWNTFYAVSMEMVPLDFKSNSDELVDEKWYRAEVKYLEDKSKYNTATFISGITFNHPNIDPKDIKIMAGNFGEEVIIDNEYQGCKLHTYRVVYQIKHPRRWYPNGLFQQVYKDSFPSLYQANVTVNYSNNTDTTTFEIRKAFGVRDIVWDTADGAFKCLVNNIPVFALGPNIIWMRNFQNSSYNENKWFGTATSTKQGKQIQTQTGWLKQMQTCGYNMLRVWGGGAYPSEKFYDYCDSLGLMVWQDFMFSGSTYPCDSLFHASVQAECKQQIQQKKSHPSLALWCGNNEIEVAWKYWGWQKEFNIHGNDSLKLWNNYLEIFNKIIPGELKKQDLETFYLRSSPVGNYGNLQQMARGDNHDWGVWHGERGFDNVLQYKMRFVSEFGMASLPNSMTLEMMLTPEKYLLSYKGMRVLCEYIINNCDTNTLSDGLKKYLLNYQHKTLPVKRLSKNELQELIALSQQVQASDYALAIRAYRMQSPYCSGALYWQFNDIWPGITWSVMDASGNYKPAYDAIAKACKPVVCLLKKDNNGNLIVGVHSMLPDVQIMKAQLKVYGQNEGITNKDTCLTFNYTWKVTGARNPQSGAIWETLQFTPQEKAIIDRAKKIILQVGGDEWVW